MRKLLLSILLLAAPAAAHAEVGDDLFQGAGEGCLETVKISLKDAINSGIEGEVKRQEAALKMPAPLSGLSCLDSLMDTNLDIAITIPDLSAIFNKALSDAENQVCSMAQEQISKLTEPLQNAFQFPQLQGLNLPGMGASGGPDIDFSIGQGGIGQSGSNVQDSGPRENAQSIMNDLYQNLYGN
ncbi:MAG TPA: hypothetical protein DD739_10355 [Ochrobactrum anthropi]|nr:hypothetical protein [Brucella anthropi]